MYTIMRVVFFMNLDFFLKKGLKLIEKYDFNDEFSTYVFEYDNAIILIDDNFDKSANLFSYSNYCEMQNRYMYQYDKVLRFNDLGDDEALWSDIKYLVSLKTEELVIDDHGGYLDKSHFDNTVAEKLFEDAFIDTYGMDSLNYLQKEVQFSLGANKTASIDFLVETKSGNYSFEANGISYHDPLIVGKDSYKNQLYRQNMLVLFGIKVYRFASNTLAFKDQIVDNLRKYLKNKDDFIPKNIIKKQRPFKLYDHQENILHLLDEDRKNGKNTTLIVLPTATGKSQICLEDLQKAYIQKEVKHILIMVPSIRIKEDWLARIKQLDYLNYHVDVLCYNYVFATRLNYPKDYYDYIIFDEAHHACAANCKKAIQYFKPKYLIGLTATPERLDKRKLEDVFGEYEVNLTLKEAIEEGVVVDISCFRLKSNLDFSKIRYNGKDYNYGDLEKNVIIDSRNELIAKTIAKYFHYENEPFKQGIVFCVNKMHCEKMAKLLNGLEIKAAAVYGGNSKNEQIFNDYEAKKIQFLCSCQLISEGWDSPQTEIIVMARPTLSKALYLQQIGRGLRHYTNKKCLYLIDVVDNYAAKLTPWSFNSLMQITNYVPFAGLLGQKEYVEILGLAEEEFKMEPVNIFTFEEEYGSYLSLEQAARELFVGTETLRGWNKKYNYASLSLPIGNKMAPYFSQADIARIRQDRGLAIHSDETILKDFLDFIEENTLTYSFKLVFLLLAFKLANSEGEINLNKLTMAYRDFYLKRIELNLPVDKPGCVYNTKYLNNFSSIKKSLLTNPFEKFERKRFFYYYASSAEDAKANKAKKEDLNIISFNPSLWEKLTKEIKTEIINKEFKFLEEYYAKYGGLWDGYQQFFL